MLSSYLLTGSSGFLGKYIDQFLSDEGYVVNRIGRSSKNNIICNLATEIPVINTNADIVIHAAGKAHSIPKTDAEKKEFYNVNLNGTRNLCKSIESMQHKPAAFVFISTVAVYGVDEGNNIEESHSLNGQTPYALSKIAAEEFLKEWCSTNDVILSILRLPLIVGSNPPGNLGAMISGLKTGKYFNINGGKAKKSMVMASDIAKWLPVISNNDGTYNLTDGYHPSFAELAALIAGQLGKTGPKNISGWIAEPIAFAGNFLGAKAPINTDKLKKITATLTFNDNHARTAFGWAPNHVLDAFSII